MAFPIQSRVRNVKSLAHRAHVALELLTPQWLTDLKRPLNKGQGHSFWYQSISHIRLPVGCQ